MEDGGWKMEKWPSVNLPSSVLISRGTAVAHVMEPAAIRKEIAA